MAFEIPDSSEVWRQIPPEEKLQIMNKAHAAGVLSTVITVIVLSTIAIGLHQNWLVWGALMAAPFTFQFASGKRWRHLRPKVMLEYLAARSAARRFAYAVGSKDMRVCLVLKGELEEIFDAEHRTEELEAEIADHKETPVWVSLFSDCIIMMSERPGGAEQEFGYILNDRLKIEGRSPSGEGDYSSRRELYFYCQDKLKNDHCYRLTSRFSAALVVFEKKALQYQKEFIESDKLVAVEVTAGPKNLFDDERSSVFE